MCSDALVCLSYALLCHISLIHKRYHLISDTIVRFFLYFYYLEWICSATV